MLTSLSYSNPPSLFRARFEQLAEHVSNNLKTHAESLQELQVSKEKVKPIQLFKLYSIRLARVLQNHINNVGWIIYRSPPEAVQIMSEIWGMIPQTEECTEEIGRHQLLLRVVACGYAFHLMDSPIWDFLDVDEEKQWKLRWTMLAYRLATWALFIFYMNLKKRSIITSCLAPHLISNLELQSVFIFSVQHFTRAQYLIEPSVCNNLLSIFSFLRDRTRENQQNLEFYLPLWGFMAYTLRTIWYHRSVYCPTSTDLQWFQALSDILKSITNAYLYVPNESMAYYILSTCFICTCEVPTRIDYICKEAPYFANYLVNACYYLLSSLPSRKDSLGYLEVLLYRVLYEFHLRINRVHLINGFRAFYEKVKENQNDSEKITTLPSLHIREMLNSLKQSFRSWEKNTFYDVHDEFLQIL